ncbi:MAG TPA: Rieske 2Fe-2S domain-containing protein [Verrucomicrobiae bacterium]|jgi:nitrite reductase/ring-hydroxylating ferredoxin subunit|nr:Rieske 2Fe-2S domain-containing protein [Verrucomicrobiae bacterium]
MESKATKPGGRNLVARVGEVQEGNSKKFVIKPGGHPVEAFLVNYEGRLYAYVNRCRHIALTLDWVDNRFFTEDGRYIICANHGATYEPRSGECVWGPCAGAFLQRVPLEIAEEKVYAICPDELED